MASPPVLPSNTASIPYARHRTRPRVGIVAGIAFVTIATIALPPPTAAQDNVLGSAAAPQGGVATSESRTALRRQLHEQLQSAHDPVLPYSSNTTTDTWDVVSRADADQVLKDHVRALYSDTLFAATSSSVETWEREHLWPQSRGTSDEWAPGTKCDAAFTDVHHLFAVEPDLNQSRSNLPFNDCLAPDCTAKGAGNLMRGGDLGIWEVRMERRGDVARALFYMDVRYEGGRNLTTGCDEPDLILTRAEELIRQTVPITHPVHYMGVLQALLRWNLEDDVDIRERGRNDAVEEAQGNRNPFIDDPSLACQLWSCMDSLSAGGGGGGGGAEIVLLPILWRNFGRSELTRPRLVTPTYTPSASPTPSATPTITPTPSITPSPTISRTPSITPTPSTTPTPSATYTPSTTPTSSATPTSPPPPPAQLAIAYLRCDSRDEYVRVQNTGGATAQLAGWDIFSVEGSQTFAFPNMSLAPGASIEVHSGPDAPPSGGSTLRWTTAYIWNNAGDEAQLLDPSGGIVDSDDC